MIFPCLVSMVGSWCSEQHRGIITSTWGTSTNIGNIVGIHVSTYIYNNTDRQWSEQMNALSAVFALNAFIAYKFMSAQPWKDEIIINIDDEI